MLGSKTYLWRITYEDGSLLEYIGSTLIGAYLHGVDWGGLAMVSIVRMEEVDMDAIPVVDEKKYLFGTTR